MTAETRAKWFTKTMDQKEMPSIEEILKFLDYVAREKEASLKDNTGFPEKPKYEGRKYGQTRTRANVNVTTTSDRSKKCPACQVSNHKVYSCPEFKKLTVEERFEVVKKARLCFNCLSSGHDSKECRSSYKCSICQKNHNYLLHKERPGVSESENQVVHHTRSVNGTGILMTAKLFVSSAKGTHKVEARALLDTAATVSIISENLARRVRLPLTRSKTVITGYGSERELGKTNYKTVMDLTTIHGGEYVTTIDALVDDRKLTVDIPMKRIDSSIDGPT